MNTWQQVALPRRLAAMSYDAVLLVAVLFVAGLPLPLIPDPIRLEPWVRYATLAYMLLVSFVYFGWFWTHGGQTLGMRAWRLRVVAADRQALSWGRAGWRFVLALLSWAPLGAGFLWSLFDAGRLAWHDRLSGTRLLRESRSSPAAQEEAPEAQEQQRG